MPPDELRDPLLVGSAHVMVKGEEDAPVLGALALAEFATDAGGAAAAPGPAPARPGLAAVRAVGGFAVGAHHPAPDGDALVEQGLHECPLIDVVGKLGAVALPVAPGPSRL